MDDGARTRDPRDHNPMLCQLSYIHRQTIRASNRPAHGAPGGNRTPDRRIRNPLLYPTELQAQSAPAREVARASERPAAPDRRRARARTCGIVDDTGEACCSQPVGCWSGREDLNLRHPAPKAGALPGCATPRRIWVANRRRRIGCAPGGVNLLRNRRLPGPSGACEPHGGGPGRRRGPNSHARPRGCFCPGRRTSMLPLPPT